MVCGVPLVTLGWWMMQDLLTPLQTYSVPYSEPLRKVSVCLVNYLGYLSQGRDIFRLNDSLSLHRTKYSYKLQQF